MYFKFQFIVLFDIGNGRPYEATAAAGRIASPGEKVGRLRRQQYDKYQFPIASPPKTCYNPHRKR